MPTTEQQHFVTAYLYDHFDSAHVVNIRTTLNINERTFLDQYLAEHYVYDPVRKHYDRRPDNDRARADHYVNVNEHIHLPGPYYDGWHYGCAACDNFYRS